MLTLLMMAPAGTPETTSVVDTSPSPPAKFASGMARLSEAEEAAVFEPGTGAPMEALKGTTSPRQRVASAVMLKSDGAALLAIVLVEMALAHPGPPTAVRVIV